MTVERKYALSKNAAGDYILPSNDGQTIWRLRRYTDGPSAGLEVPRDREFWGVWKWRGEVAPGEYLNLDDPDQWNMVEQGLLTRGEAIDAALTVVGAATVRRRADQLVVGDFAVHEAPVGRGLSDRRVLSVESDGRRVRIEYENGWADLAASTMVEVRQSGEGEDDERTR